MFADPAASSSVQCQFPARYQLLKRQFAVAEPVECPQYQRWKQENGLESASLFYASQYLSNPASVFGHSFLLLRSPKTQEYAQMTFNYSAETMDGENPFLYAFRGLTGGYQGKFSLAPLYYRLHIYSDMESRDLWEYKLNLSAAELEMLASLLWELHDKVRLDYFFLDRNCGSVLLWILKVVRPNTDISVAHPLYLAPGELPKILDREKLVANIIYHPSMRQKLEWKLALMSSPQLQAYHSTLKTADLGEGDHEPLLLEAWLDALALERYQWGDRLPATRKQFERAVLLQRAQHDQAAAITVPTTQQPGPPHLGHGPMRLSLGFARAETETALTLSYRPAIHGLLDHDQGYLRHSAIEALELELWHSNLTPLVIESFQIFSMSNFPSIGRQEWPMSWAYRVRVERNHWVSTHAAHLLGLAARTGYSADLGVKAITGYLMAAADARVGEISPRGHFDFGPLAGVFLSLGPLRASTELAWQAQLVANQSSNLIVLRQEARCTVGREASAFMVYEHSRDPNSQAHISVWKTGASWDF